MSVIFGRWNFQGRSPLPDCWSKVRAALAVYGPDGCQSYSKEGLDILFHAFHTTAESRGETQPFVTRSGAVVTWDGRLDNRDELIRRLESSPSSQCADVCLVAAAYEHWGTRCFPQLVGDWALSIFDPNNRSLTLAKDPIGLRHLYYSFNREEIFWTTILDPLVLFPAKRVALNEEYIAGWFSSFPAVHVTPYVGVHAVPPSSFVTLQAARRVVTEYWNFDSHHHVRYRTDAEYEEHFRAVFAESVRRRLRSDTPVLAELSGGMDSSSIVCMADSLIMRGTAQTPQLDTLSYYDNSEPNWNEEAFFTKVEERRGHIGFHVDIAGDQIFQFRPASDRFAAMPSHSPHESEANRQFTACIALKGNRVVLSGLGGDEVTGGVPSPTPELADLLATGRFRALARQLLLWALNKRKPWFHLFSETCRGFLPGVLVGIPNDWRPAPWLQRAFVERNRKALVGPDRRLRLFGPLPSFQENVNTLDLLRRQLATDALSPDALHETRYPFLDRDLLEFLFAVPRDQLVRPGQRRSLMRRSLAGIVPNEVLNRKRKAYASRAPAAAISDQWSTLCDMAPSMVSTSLGIVDDRGFCESVQKAKDGQEIPIIFLARTLAVECWLQSLLPMCPLTPPTFEFRGQPLERAKPRSAMSDRRGLTPDTKLETIPCATRGQPDGAKGFLS